MSSLWNEGLQPPKFPPVSRDMKTDVLIVGGGLAGLLCARALRERGVDCMLVEAERICGGVTENTTAKITSQHGAIYHKLLARLGKEKAKLYWQANEAAVKQYRTLSQDIDCDFEEREAYVYSRRPSGVVAKEWKALQRLGIPATHHDRLPLPFAITGAICFEKQAQLHPLKLAYAIARDLPIFEKTKVLELANGIAVTNRGRIRAEKIVIATHFPILNKHGLYFLKQYQHRSYVLALRGVLSVKGMYVDENEGGLSFRSYGDLLLLGGGSHRTGAKGGNWQELADFAALFYPRAEEVGRWATQDCMTLDGMPYIGEYSSHTKGLYVATGFNKWGMTSSMVAADVLADLLTDRKNDYAALFSPSRTILHPQLAANAGKAIWNLISLTAPRCPHMGCALKYNRAEHTWDCPCHGSRFDENGKLLDNPATGDHPTITARQKNHPH